MRVDSRLSNISNTGQKISKKRYLLQCLVLFEYTPRFPAGRGKEAEIEAGERSKGEKRDGEANRACKECARESPRASD